MTKRNKLSAFLAVILSLCFVLTACGKEPAVHIIDDQSQSPEYLSFFSPSQLSDGDVAKYWTERFTEQYNKQIYIYFAGEAYYNDEGFSYRELLEKRLKSSDPDDIYIINAEDVLAFEKAGYWLDLSEMNFVDNLSDAALYQSMYNGKVFSVPLSFTGFGFVWNVKMLKSYGLTVPQNLNEFLNVCEVLLSNGILPYGANKGYGLTTIAMAAGLSELYKSENQLELIDDLNSGKTPISRYLKKGYEFLAMMIEKGYLDPQQALNSTPQKEDMEMFFNEECAFVSLSLGWLYEIDLDAFEVQMTGLPILDEGAVAIYGASNRLCVNPNSRHLETALEFIEMVGSPEALEMSAQLEHSMSSASGSNAAPTAESASIVDLLQQPGQIPNQDFALHFNTWESIRDVARTLCSGSSVEQACELLDEKQQAELKEYGTQ